ncbi:MAG: flagellar hook-basal body complex protein FliE [Spirochaetaceae bacterium]|nr:MAG: flagellar hook-basal body complex protein FliE [Spirochaetaceae bacterium]
MRLLSPEQVHGDVFRLEQTNPRHVAGRYDQPAAQPAQDFRSMLFDGLNTVNQLQRSHAELSVQAIIDPESVHPHDVTIAGAKANMSLNIARNVVDRVIRAYRDVVNIR